ncbi:MAG: LptF/LptG family permease [Rhodothermales bacterium]
MKRLHRMLLANLPGPFVAAFGTLLFLLLMQFLINYLPELVGRGLPASVIAELIAYSLAYMVVLAVPMAVLVSTLLVFARLAESQAYAVAKSAGISLFGLAWPVLLASVFVAGAMMVFNNDVLPEANYRMKGLWQDIREKKPGFELEPGVFYDGIQGYAIRVADTPAESNALDEVLIFDESEAGQRTTITAERGELETLPGGSALQMTLYDGEIHRLGHVRDDGRRTERYERVLFDRHRLRLDLSDLAFERRDTESTSRSDRTMRTSQMIALVDSLDANAAARTATLRDQLAALGRPPNEAVPQRTTALPNFAELTQQLAARKAAATGEPLPDSVPTTPTASPFTASALRASDAARETAPDTLAESLTDSLAAADTLSAPSRPILAGLDDAGQQAVYQLAAQRMRSVKSEIDAAQNALRWERQRADRYRVEIYKKYSMAVACVVFVLIGIPLGLSVRRGGLGVVGTLAVGIFLFYWITLVQGEKLADRDLLQPWVGMWAANALIGGLGLYLLVRESRDPASRDPLKRLLARFRPTPTR